MFFTNFSSGNLNLLPKNFLQKQQNFPSEYKNDEKVTNSSEKKPNNHISLLGA